MNTDELIVMGVLMILAGGLMVARHFVHTMEIPAPMATRKVDIGNTEEDLPINAAIAEEEVRLIPRMEHIEDIDNRIAKLEERHHYHVERQVLDYEALEERVLDLEEFRYLTLKERDEAMEDRLAELEERLDRRSAGSIGLLLK